MRRTLPALLLGLAGCLSAPTGIDPGDVDAGGGVWPPAGAEVRALAGGDVDGDGKDDLVAVDVANDTLYLLRGGVDVGVAGAPTPRSYSRAVALEGLDPPVAVAIGTGRVVVVLDGPATGPRLRFLSSALAVTGTATFGMPGDLPPSTAVWLRSGPFGASGDAMFATVPSAAVFVEGDRLDDPSPEPRVIPTPSLSAAVLATGYRGNPPTLVVAELGKVQRGTENGPGVFTWSDVRDGGTWLSQSTYDVSGDGAIDVVGFDVAPSGTSQMCVTDVKSGTTGCADSRFMMDAASWIEVGPLVAGEIDVAVIHPMGAAGQLFLLPRLTYSGGTATAMAPPGPKGIAVAPVASALVQVVAGGPPELMVVATTGAMACVQATTAPYALVDCAP